MESSELDEEKGNITESSMRPLGAPEIKRDKRGVGNMTNIAIIFKRPTYQKHGLCWWFKGKFFFLNCTAGIFSWDTGLHFNDVIR